AHSAEVVRRIDEASTEMIMPDPVDNGPPGQDVPWVGHPPGQSGTAAAFVMTRQTESGLETRQAGECPGYSLCTWLIDVASLLKVNRARRPGGAERAIRLEVVGSGVYESLGREGRELPVRLSFQNEEGQSSWRQAAKLSGMPKLLKLRFL